MDWPDINTWQAGAEIFSALGTVGAFAVGFVLLQREHQREAARARDDERSQAVKVSAWIEAKRTTHGARELVFCVHNASDMPIYEVSLLSPVPIGDEHEAEFIGLVPPGQTVQRPAPREWLKTYFSPEPVQIEFLDSGGLQWSRDEQGALIQHGESSAQVTRGQARLLSTRTARAGAAGLAQAIAKRRRRPRSDPEPP